MMTRSDFRMPHCAVWLLLVAILCVAVLPTVAVAKLIDEIATEGDPGDGMDSTGSGGGGDFSTPDDGLQYSESGAIEIENIGWIYFDLIPVWNEKGLSFRVEFWIAKNKLRRNI